MWYYRSGIKEPKGFKEGIVNKKNRLHLGCGFSHYKGFVNLDVSSIVKPDIVHDLMKSPYPFPEDHFDEVISGMVFAEVDDWHKILPELHRISKDGAIWHIAVPYYNSPSAFNPVHKHFFHADSFNQYISPKSKFKKNATHGFPYYFDIIDKEFVPANLFSRLLPGKLRNYMGQIFGNMVSRIWFTMRVYKNKAHKPTSNQR